MFLHSRRLCGRYREWNFLECSAESGSLGLQEVDVSHRFSPCLLSILHLVTGLSQPVLYQFPSCWLLNPLTIHIVNGPASHLPTALAGTPYGLDCPFFFTLCCYCSLAVISLSSLFMFTALLIYILKSICPQLYGTLGGRQGKCEHISHFLF